MKRKFYAVHVGKTPGVYTSWNEAQSQISGVRGAVFKKFTSEADARYFVEHGNFKQPEISLDGFHDALHVFTDGAYSSKTKRAGMGVAFSTPFRHLSEAKILPSGSTHQLAELEALSVALWLIDRHQYEIENPVWIWTDSDYSVKCVRDYLPRWEASGWVTSSGKPVKHQATIRSIKTLLDRLPSIQLHHISELGLTSHQAKADLSGYEQLVVWEGNDRADKLARGC